MNSLENRIVKFILKHKLLTLATIDEQRPHCCTRIQGIQFKGRFYQPTDIHFAKAKSMYLKKFPVAIFIPSSLWVLEIDFIKMTDNTLGFGKKLIWNRENQDAIHEMHYTSR